MYENNIKIKGYNSINMLWEIEFNGKKETVTTLTLQGLIANNIVIILDKYLDGTSIYNQTNIDSILFMVGEKYKNKPYKTIKEDYKPFI
jgi:hypothetical protein